VSGKITKRRMAGQTFSAAYATRTVFSCEPDPACDVPPVVDADLPAESGTLDLVVNGGDDDVEVIASGDVALGYLAGCGGYASEAPTFVYRASSSSGSVRFQFQRSIDETDSAGILVVTPSGAAHCAANTVELTPETGSYAVWVRALTPGAPVEGYVYGNHRVP
jgi:hypothetical protein